MGAKPAQAIILHCSPHCLPDTRESTKKQRRKRKKCCYENVLAKYMENCQESVNKKANRSKFTPFPGNLTITHQLQLQNIDIFQLIWPSCTNCVCKAVFGEFCCSTLVKIHQTKYNFIFLPPLYYLNIHHLKDPKPKGTRKLSVWPFGDTYVIQSAV